MKKIRTIIATVAMAGAILSTSATANETESPLDNLYVGVQASDTSGLSIKYALTDKIKIQGILGVIGDVTMYSGRGLFSFLKKNDFDFYGYGSLGVAHWSNSYYDETAMSYGLGGGAEYDIRAIDKSYPPIFLNAELGMGYVNFNNYNTGGIDIGLGVFYKF